jgi:hypothetical protein
MILAEGGVRMSNPTIEIKQTKHDNGRSSCDNSCDLFKGISSGYTCKKAAGDASLALSVTPGICPGPGTYDLVSHGRVAELEKENETLKQANAYNLDTNKSLAAENAHLKELISMLPDQWKNFIYARSKWPDKETKHGA